MGKCLLMFILFYSKGEWERKRDGERGLELFNKIIQCINNGLYSNNETKNGLGLVVFLLSPISPLESYQTPNLSFTIMGPKLRNYFVHNKRETALRLSDAVPGSPG